MDANRYLKKLLADADFMISLKKFEEYKKYTDNNDKVVMNYDEVLEMNKQHHRAEEE